eukprot:6384942-Lingulodinium_polyedra.AAC.1
MERGPNRIFRTTLRAELLGNAASTAFYRCNAAQFRDARIPGARHCTAARAWRARLAKARNATTMDCGCNATNAWSC